MRRAHKLVISFSAALFVIGGVFVLGVSLGYANRPPIDKVAGLLNKESAIISPEESVDFSPFWETWNTIDEKFMPADGEATSTPERSPKKEAEHRLWGAIGGLVDSLGDPYSVFLPPSDAKIFEENIQGNFGGVGMEIGIRDGILTVITPLKNTPAERAGLLSGDKVLAIDGTPTQKMAVDEAVKIIRGEIGTTVTLTIKRGKDESKKEPFEVKVERAVISIPTIDTEKRPDGIFVIKLYSFSATSPELFREALREFVLAENDKLILDLRGNPGGYLEAAVDMASWFLPAGKVVATEDFGESKDPLVYRSKGYNIFNDKLKMVILVNQGSASASEILAGALSEHKKAVLVGDTTFGKGSVQELIKVTPDASLKLTIAHWLTPDGNWISKGGITPEYKVVITDKEREEGKDPQLEKAVSVLQKEQI
ncbi:S41 family peptidase [Candidatus Uhrbacteria bacterium]|nr:S41 family peptidase [Candidatus Uhrbacteria bacterium]